MSKCIRRKRKTYWSIRENRISATRSLVEKLNKRPEEVTSDDFERNGLGTVLWYYGKSPTKALIDAGYKFIMWDRTCVPQGYWNKKTNRVNAVRWLVRTVGKPVNKIIRKDFIEHNLSGLIGKRKPIPVLLREAGYKIPFWGKGRMITPGFWNDRIHREDAVRELLKKLNKNPSTITYKDFIDNGLGTLVRCYYSSLMDLLMDLGFITSPLQRKPKPRGYWYNKENRRKAIRSVVEASGKPIYDIEKNDFIKAGISGMVYHFYKTTYMALRDAGYDIQPWELKIVPYGFWDKKENRVNAIKWLISKANKPPYKLGIEDFKKHNLMRLCICYRRKRAKNYPRGEFFEYDEGYLLRYKSPVKRALVEAELIPP